MEYYTAKQIGKMLGVAPETIKKWESENLIGVAIRRGGRRTRLWSSPQVDSILDFAQSIGYIPQKEAVLVEGGQPAWSS